MRNVFGWVGMREQQRMILAAREHMDKVIETVGYLKQALQHFVAGDLEQMKQWQQRVFAAEREADDLRRDLLNRLSEGMFLPTDRGDLVQLVERVDDIADYANGAGRLLIVFPAAPPASLHDNIVLYGHLLEKATKQLGDALDKLAAGDGRKTLELCTAVERTEEEADNLKATIYKQLFAMDLPAALLLLLHDLIEAMENTADKAEDAADLVRLLAVKIR